MPRWLYLAAGGLLALLIFSLSLKQKVKDIKETKNPLQSHTPKPLPYYNNISKNTILNTANLPQLTTTMQSELTSEKKEFIINNLQSIGQSYKPASLSQIDPWLSNPDKDIRSAALNAVLLIGDPAGACLLRKAAKSVDDPREASVLLDKADYLELPSFKLGNPRKSAP